MSGRALKTRISIGSTTPATGGSRREISVSGITSTNIFSTVSQTSTVLAVQQLQNSDTLKARVIQFVKLSFVMLPPLISLILISWLTITQTSQSMTEAKFLMEQIIFAEQKESVAKFIQKERGMSCVLLSASGNNTDMLKSLNKVREDLDTAIIKARLENPAFEPIARSIEYAIRGHRALVDASYIDCTETLRRYTGQVDSLLSQIFSTLGNAATGEAWAIVASYMSMLNAIDLVSIQEAEAGVYFAAGGLDDETYSNYFETAGGAKHLLESAFSGYPAAKAYHNNLRAENELLIFNIGRLNNEIVHRTAQTGDSDKALTWFYQMSDYIDLLLETEHMISGAVLQKVWKQLSFATASYYMEITVVVIALVVSPLAMSLNAIQSQRLINKVRKFTNNLSKKTAELNTEKQKTDLLLHQMLPPSIVRSLKRNEEVYPEQFESVTLFFSDILGFTTLAGRCSPMEVVQLLNSLYSKCDQILDQYDVYKVETIGDSYMVASGLPKRNGEAHSAEISTLALDILRMMEDFTVPYTHAETMLMRIGIHTGPCAAGIVGLKMPRYCLFGDTVNVASRMESSGKAMRIQVSEACGSHLRNNSASIFKMKPRGQIAIKGKGNMNTYWLTGKQGFHYSIDLARAEEKQHRSSYWRVDGESTNDLSDFEDLESVVLPGTVF